MPRDGNATFMPSPEPEAWAGDVVNLFLNGCRGSARQRLGIDRMPSRHRITAKHLGLLTVAALAFSAVAPAQDQEVPAMMQKNGCSICHSDRETMAGPAWVDIAAAYRGNPKAETALAAVVKKGVHGNGPWPMPPLPEVSDADTRKIVHYILAQKR